MKVLLVNKYHNVQGGSETYYFGLADMLTRCGHEVIFFSMADERNIPCEQAQYFVSNVDFNGKTSVFKKISAGFRVLYSFEAKRKITDLIKREKPDIVHINLVHRHLTLSIVRAIRKYNIPIVHTVHDLNSICPNHEMLVNGKICDKCLSGNYWNCVKQRCMNGSTLKSTLAALEAINYRRMGIYHDMDLYITPSAFYKKLLERSGITASPIVHMKNFLPVDTVYKTDNPDKGYLLYLGRLSEEKGILTLLRAVKSTTTPVKLLIAGTGKIEGEIREYIHTHSLENRVEMLGFQSGDALRRTVAMAKCIVLPSEWYENGPYAIMEAMSQGKPVIASRIGGLPEMIEDGKTGFLCQPFDSGSLKDCIEKIMTLTDEEYRQMGRNAAVRAKQEFCPDAYVGRLLRYYNQLIAGNTICGE